jgi:hypothetical protein
VKIVVGLGNPGDQYARTRHNVGWMVLDRIADRAGWAGRGRTRDAAAVVQGRFPGLDLVLVKPLTYMNLSGTAVRKVLARERAPLTDLLVTDDFALPSGRQPRESGAGGQRPDAIIERWGPRSSTASASGSATRPGARSITSSAGSTPEVCLDEPPMLHAVERGPTGSKAANRHNALTLRAADERASAGGDVDGPPGPTGSGGRRPAGGGLSRGGPTATGDVCRTMRSPVR